jgi:transcriptional regulator with XRE-family HTH domain
VALYSANHAALGGAIRRLREQRGITQEDLAHEAALHRAYVGAVERGERNLSFANLLKVCDGLDVSLATLAGEYEREIDSRT